MRAEFRDGREFRVLPDGRTLAGVAMRYGDTADLGAFRERFMPGAFAPIGEVSLNLQHDSSRVLARTGGNGLVVSDGPRSLELRAELTGSAELELVRRGGLSGFSIEFYPLDQRIEGDVRILSKARLEAIALVDRGAYSQSKAEVRAKLGQTMRASIPSGRKLDCDCVGQGCQVEFEEDSLVLAGGDVIAAYSNYQSPLASTARGTLRTTPRAGGMVIEIDLPDDDAGRAVLAASSSAGVVARPFVDQRTAVHTTGGDGTRTYSHAPVRAIIVSATDKREGWPIPALIATPALNDEPEVRRAAPGKRRRLWL